MSIKDHQKISVLAVSSQFSIVSEDNTQRIHMSPSLNVQLFVHELGVTTLMTS